MKLFFVALFVATTSCSPIGPNDPTNVVVDTTDASYPEMDSGLDAVHLSKCARVCAQLRALKCPEGFESSCEPGCDSAVSSNVTSFSADCAADAGDIAHMRKCGVRCAVK